MIVKIFNIWIFGLFFSMRGCGLCQGPLGEDILLRFIRRVGVNQAVRGPDAAYIIHVHLDKGMGIGPSFVQN